MQPRGGMITRILRRIAATSALLAPFACAGATDDDIGVEADDAELTGAKAPVKDQFRCFVDGNVVSPGGPSLACRGAALVGSKACRAGRDYDIVSSTQGVEKRVAILAPHGGNVDEHTETIALRLKDTLQAPYFVFTGHPGAQCTASTGSAFHALHVTATGYNAAGALDVLGVDARTRGVAIHGQQRTSKVCVGGGSAAARSAFITCWASLETGFTAVDVDDPDCASLGGTDPKNIVNRGRGGQGLQLEMPQALRELLASPKASNAALATAVRSAMGLGDCAL